MDNMVTQHQAVSQILERQGMLRKSWLAGEARYVSNSNHKMVIFQLRCLWPEPSTGRDGLVLQIDGFDFPGVEIGFRTESANWRDSVQDSDTSGNHLGQHRLEDQVVLLADQSHFDSGIRFKEFFQRDGGIHSPEPTPDDEYPRSLRLHWTPPHRVSQPNSSLTHVLDHNNRTLLKYRDLL